VAGGRGAAGFAYDTVGGQKEKKNLFFAPKARRAKEKMGISLVLQPPPPTPFYFRR
jgi:hypothetical protein